jgi:predicted nucleic acid-binding Zn ribbon protein
LPKSAAILRGDEYFCSDECARLYLAGRASN